MATRAGCLTMALRLPLLVLLLWLPSVYTADPTLTNATVNLGGNTADQDSRITWAPLDPGSPYKARANEPDSSMKPFYDLARSFANTVFGDFPLEAIDDLMKGRLDFGSDWQKVVMPMIGFGVCVAVGFLFIFIFTIVGCCLCCCRCCCNNCGGKMVQERDGGTNCRRHAFGIVMFIIVAFTAVGMACSYVNNERMTTTFTGMKTLIDDNLDDVSTFLNNTVKQMEEIKGTKLDFTIEVLYRDLDSIGFLLGIPIREVIKGDTGLNTAIQSVQNLVTDMDTTFQKMETVVTDFNALVTAAEILKHNLTTVAAEIKAANSSYDTTALNADFDASQLPNITAESEKLASVRSKNYTALLAQASSEVDNIPERVVNESRSGINDIKTQVDNYKSALDGPVNTIKNMTKMLNIKSLMGDVDIDTYLTTAQGYEKYRWYAGVGLTCTILLVVVLQFVGLAFGFFGTSAGDLPTERGCLGTAGGNMLVASTVFIFIFSWLLMLLTTLTFIVGAPMEKYMCASLRDPNLTFIGKALHLFSITKTDKLEFNISMGDGQHLTLNVPDVLAKCRNHSALMGAVDVSSVFNLSILTNYKSQLNIDSQLNSFAPDFSSVSILPADLETQLDNFKTSVGINFTAFYAELSKDPTSGSLDAFITDLGNAAGFATGQTQTDLNAAKTKLEGIRSNEYANMIAAKTTLNMSVAALEAAVVPIPGKIDTVLANFNHTQEYLNNNGTQLAQRLVRTFADRIFSILDSFINFIQGALFHDVGRCTPVSNIVDTLLVGGVCGLVIDPLNGFWCALGWCLFFYVFAVIFALKLSKHYRRMNALHEKDPEYEAKESPYQGDPPPFSNKVGHSDKY